MVNIIYLIAESGISGGTRVVSDLLKNIDRKYFRVFLIAPTGGLIDEAKQFCQEISVVEMPNKSFLKSVLNIRWAIQKIIGRYPASKNIFHIHGTRGLIFGALAGYKLPLKKIYTEHLWTNDFHLPNKWREKTQLLTLKLLVKSFHKIVTVSQAVKDFLVFNHLASAQKIAVIYNGVQPLPENTVNYVNKELVVIGSFGSLNFTKNYSALIEIVKNIQTQQPFVVKIYGLGPEQEKLQLQIDEQGLNEIIKIEKPVSEAILTLKLFDIYVQTSKSESFGLAVLEAMSVGLPIIAYNVGGLPELMENGIDGILIEQNNTRQFSEKLKELIEYSQARRILGEHAFGKAKQFPLVKFIERHEKLYEQIN